MIFITNLIKIQINGTISNKNKKSPLAPASKALINWCDYWQTRWVNCHDYLIFTTIKPSF